MAKKVAGFVKLQLPAGKATMAPPVGPALGQHGANIMEFVKSFNSATASKGDAIVPVEITIYADRSFTFITKTPPASYLIRKAAKITKGSGQPNKDKVGKLSWAQCIEIGKEKMEDINANDEVAAANIIAGTARSMGVIVEGKPLDA
ncbi:MAG TPA: 50S ribosomal protein L11 [Trueperaceae bacterium]|nr:50S ribosomal protein L11 [Trueperaceae bacterium]